MNAPDHNLYRILGVSEQALFAELKKAYYRRAKECHPDLHPGQPSKEEEFKQLVRAFGVLSDPIQRREYDQQVVFARMTGETEPGRTENDFVPRDGDPIMDSIADDLLEELVVGNYVPHNATLQTLMRDLESTHKFIRFREARTQFEKGEHKAAYELFGQSITDSPGNILYHYYYGQAAWKLRMKGLAQSHLETCLEIGGVRMPPQQLLRVRRELDKLRRSSLNPFSRVKAWLKPPPKELEMSSEQKMIEEMNASMTRVMRERSRADRRLQGGQERKRLGH